MIRQSSKRGEFGGEFGGGFFTELTRSRLRRRVPELADDPPSLADFEEVEMIDHGTVLIGFPNRGGCDSVRDLNLEHLAIERLSNAAGTLVPIPRRPSPPDQRRAFRTPGDLTSSSSSTAKEK